MKEDNTKFKGLSFGPEYYDKDYRQKPTAI